MSVVESSRVFLQPIRGIEGSDYINASFIDVSQVEFNFLLKRLHNLVLRTKARENNIFTTDNVFLIRVWCPN